MLKPEIRMSISVCAAQPPSGGCVLKLSNPSRREFLSNQPPSGGCVLKHLQVPVCFYPPVQPPSGGCVLKPFPPLYQESAEMPAAFRRLCVETLHASCVKLICWPAAFRRLCVETSYVCTGEAA